MKTKHIALATLTLVAAAAVMFSLLRAGDSHGPVSPTEVAKLLSTNRSAVVLDVRTKQEYDSETGHLSKAILIPVQELEQRVGELSKYKKRDIVVYCRSGHRSTTAAEILVKNGFKVYNMAGGITRWRAEGLPVVKEAP